MADLTGSTIASSYDQLLAMPSGGGNGATLVALTDGNAGNTFALQLSTGEVKSTGTLTVSGITTMAGDLRLEDDAGGEYFGIGTPATVTTYTLTVPAAVGGSGQALRTSDGSGTLEWYTPETGDITSVVAGTNLNGGGSSGDVTLNLDTTITGLSSVTSTAFAGALTGNVTGNVSGTAATVTGATQAAITTCANLTTVGTIGTGVWQGTAVDGTYIDLEGTELKSTGPEAITKYLRADGDGTCSWQTVSATVTIDSTSIGSGTAGSVLFVNSSNQLSQDNDKLFWDNTGNNLLVGKTSTALDVDGVRIDSAGRIEVARTSTSTAIATNSGGNLSLANPSATDGNFSNIGGYNSNELVDSQINFIHTSHSGRTGEISFSTHNGTSLVEAVRIDSSGDTSLTTQGAKLKFLEDGSSAYMSITNAAGPKLQILNSSDGAIATFENGGNVGIGTTAPSSDIGFAKIIQITDANSVGIKFDATSYNAWEIGTGTSSEFIIADGGVGRVSVDTSGNVDILAGKLSLDTNLSEKTIWCGGYGGGILMKRSDATGDRYAKFGILDGSGGFVSGITVDTGGDVGIGTTVPNFPVNIYGASTDLAGLVLRNTNATVGDKLKIGFDAAWQSASEYGSYVGVEAMNVSGGSRAEDMIFGVRNQSEDGSDPIERLRITAGGNVGIGLGGAAPAYALQVKKATDPRIKLEDGSTYQSHWLIESVAGTRMPGTVIGDTIIACNAGRGMHFGEMDNDVQGTVNMSILATGDVGLGVSPVTKLTVEGAVTLKEQAAADTDTAAYGQIWVKTGTPNTLYFTDDAGTDVQLGASGSSGVTALSEASSVAIDFSGTKHQTLEYTGTCDALTSSNLSAGKEIELRIFSNDTSGYTDFSPSSIPAWKLLGTSLSGTGVAATSYGVLKLTSWGTTDADVTAELQITAT